MFQNLKTAVTHTLTMSRFHMHYMIIPNLQCMHQSFRSNVRKDTKEGTKDHIDTLVLRGVIGSKIIIGGGLHIVTVSHGNNV